MKHIKKIAGSVILAAALTVSSVGAFPAQSNAATTAVTPADFIQIIEKVEAATKAIAAANVVKTLANITVEAMGQKKNTILETATDPNTGVLRFTAPNVDLSDMTSMLGGGEIETENAYVDLKSHVMYEFNKKLNRYELSVAPIESNILGSIFSKDFFTKFEKLITLGDMVTDTIEGKTIISIPIKLKIDAAHIKSLLELISSKSPIQGLDTIASFIKDVDITITPFIDPTTYLIGQMTANGSINIDIMGSPITINIDTDEKNSVSTDPVNIPDDVVNTAQLKAGYTTDDSGLVLTAVLSGSNTVMSVSGVKKASATKLTVPATVNEYGKDYKVSKAESNAFKKAKKLKTLVVKNSALKKALKKNPSKYGLKKSVKIK